MCSVLFTQSMNGDFTELRSRGCIHWKYSNLLLKSNMKRCVCCVQTFINFWEWFEVIRSHDREAIEKETWIFNKEFNIKHMWCRQHGAALTPAGQTLALHYEPGCLKKNTAFSIQIFILNKGCSKIQYKEVCLLHRLVFISERDLKI